jgi:hypothetical protein
VQSIPAGRLRDRQVVPGEPAPTRPGPARSQPSGPGTACGERVGASPPAPRVGYTLGPGSDPGAASAGPSAQRQDSRFSAPPRAVAPVDGPARARLGRGASGVPRGRAGRGAGANQAGNRRGPRPLTASPHTRRPASPPGMEVGTDPSCNTDQGVRASCKVNGS